MYFTTAKLIFTKKLTLRVKKIAVIVCLVFAFLGKAQNLVPNGSFEEYYQLPNQISQINYCKNWFSASSGSPDYFSSQIPNTSPVYIPSSIFGYQSAFEGNFYTGIYTKNIGAEFAVEYIEVKLSSPLIGQKCYDVSFYISLADSISCRTVNNIGAYFSADSIYSNQLVRLSQYTPQILNDSINPLTNKIGWTKVSGIFLAQGGERYITIGNFNLPENDDTNFVAGCTMGNSYGYIFIDSVTVKKCGEVGITENPLTQTNLYPNPTTSIAYIDKPATEACVVELYDAQGRLLFSQNYSKGITRAELNLSGQAPGLYFCRVLFAGGRMESGRLVVQ